jgi:uracil-DNA glycosylase family 4
MNEDRYFQMVETFLLAKRYLKQQIELGNEEIFLTKKTKKASFPQDLGKFHAEIKDCVRCSLHKTRTNFVFGVGNPESPIMFIGEAPGREEDLRGEPFVGAAGRLLDKILEAIKFKREEIYIANVLKCRPPENRDPLPEEVEKCEPYLLKQIEIIKPKLICALGRISSQALLKTKLPLNKLRGRFHDYHGIKLLVTYHPAALLRYPQYKRETWEDVQILRKEYDSLVG